MPQQHDYGCVCLTCVLARMTLAYMPPRAEHLDDRRPDERAQVSSLPANETEAPQPEELPEP